MVTLDLKQYILISVQTWLSAELAEECCSVCFCFKETPDLHPLRKIRHRAFGIIVFHRKSFTFWSLSLLCLHWPAGGEVFINFCCPPGLTPTPGPPLSAPDEKTSCTNSGAWAYVADFTERVKESSQTGLPLPCWITFSNPNLAQKGQDSQHVCYFGLAVSSPGLSPLPSSPLPPPRLGSHGLLLWWGGNPEPLHAQVRERCLQSHRRGLKRVRLPTWGVLHADGVNALVPPVWRGRPGAEPRRLSPDRLP